MVNRAMRRYARQTLKQRQRVYELALKKAMRQAVKGRETWCPRCGHTMTLYLILVDVEGGNPSLECSNCGLGIRSGLWIARDLSIGANSKGKEKDPGAT